MMLTISMTSHQSPANAAVSLVSLLLGVTGWILVLILVRARPTRYRIAIET